MASLVSPTPASLTIEVEDLRARVNHLASGLTRAQFNWQPDSGRKWSVGQCFDHLALANKLYLDAVTQAVDAAPPEPANRSFVARANALGGWFASTLEPSAGWRLKAPRAIQPASDLDPAHTLHRFDDSLARLVALIPRAWAIDPNRTRFKNPLARGWRLFNITAAFQILTAHSRRHVWQAEQVRGRPEGPRE
jgi:hypothetical protein